MVLIGLLLLSFLSRAQEFDSSLDRMEHLSTDIKLLSKDLQSLFEVSTKESIPMLEIESSMTEMENLVMQLENHISTLPSSL